MQNKGGRSWDKGNRNAEREREREKRKNINDAWNWFYKHVPDATLTFQT